MLDAVLALKVGGRQNESSHEETLGCQDKTGRVLDSEERADLLPPEPLGSGIKFASFWREQSGRGWSPQRVKCWLFWQKEWRGEGEFTVIKGD